MAVTETKTMYVLWQSTHYILYILMANEVLSLGVLMNISLCNAIIQLLRFWLYHIIIKHCAGTTLLFAFGCTLDVAAMPVHHCMHD